MGCDYVPFHVQMPSSHAIPRAHAAIYSPVATCFIIAALLCGVDARSLESSPSKMIGKIKAKLYAADSEAHQTLPPGGSLPLCSVPNQEPCPDGNPGVKCKSDPCQDKVCGKLPEATCYPFICQGKAKYRGEWVGGGCETLFVDNKCNVVNCKK